MAVLLDPPRWPAHATLWSHLVSDSSLAELHTFAARAGVPPRAFDGDHYDVPASQQHELVALGALAVPGTELITRLRASGLRVSKRERLALDARLLAGWADLAPAAAAPDKAASPGGGAPPEAPEVASARWAALGDDLLGRWHERGRLHHGVTHLAEVVTAVETLASAVGLTPAERRRALLGAWFHDAVHRSGRRTPPPGASTTAGTAPTPDDGGPSDEDASAALAGRLLAEDPDRDAVAALVLMTKDHRPAPDNRAAAVLSDADLAVLGAAPQRYDDYAAAIRQEYSDVPTDLFRPGRAAILGDLVRGQLFHTEQGRERWEAPARANLEREIAALTS